MGVHTYIVIHDPNHDILAGQGERVCGRTKPCADDWLVAWLHLEELLDLGPALEGRAHDATGIVIQQVVIVRRLRKAVSMFAMGIGAVLALIVLSLIPHLPARGAPADEPTTAEKSDR